MRDILFPFQETAIADLHKRIRNAHLLLAPDNPQIISFSAPTGAGKTIIMTALFEDIFYGTADELADPDAIIVWLSDSPQLNEQSRMKLERHSDRLRVGDFVTIDADFVREALEPGKIYFLNTQKLGADKRLTTLSDARAYTIWDTLANTAQRMPEHLYVVIDEAHRGTAVSKQAENKANSIMQKFIKGSAEDGLPPMPLVIGITATPQRFDALIAGTSSTVQKVVVPPSDVRESGLLKDRIILHIPEIALTAELTVLESAVRDWQDKCRRWEAYCDAQHEKAIAPALVVQVEDGSGSEVSRTDIRACMETIERAIGRPLAAGEAAHTFNDQGTLSFEGYELPYVEPSQIQDDARVRIVFFKMNLSTGWDCPRAETMMSFRGAQDSTYIAQLLGRMIRTPLARRIESDAALNDVSLFLPYFDKEAAQTVIKALRDDEHIPGETGTDRELITLARNPAYADVFDGFADLVTYRIDAARRQPALRLWVQLSRNLTMDGIDLNAQRATRNRILSMMDDAIAAMRADGSYEEKRTRITGFAMGTLTYDTGDETWVYDAGTGALTISGYDIQHQYEKAGKILGEGLHQEYWIHHSDRPDYAEVHTEVIVLANDASFMEQLDACAKESVNALYEQWKRDIRRLPENRREAYRQIMSATADAVPAEWTLPETLDWTATDHDESFERHLYVREDGSFQTALNDWESGLLREELSRGIVCWLRNVDRKRWALAIPYEVNGIVTPMYPDLVVVRADSHGYVFDILEPHDPSRKDNCPKAIGLARFADKHDAQYGRIQLIRKKKGSDGQPHFYRLDLAKLSIRNKVRGITSNPELDRIFDEEAVRED